MRDKPILNAINKLLNESLLMSGHPIIYENVVAATGELLTSFDRADLIPLLYDPAKLSEALASHSS